MEKEKYETCVHAKFVGEQAVFVDAGCPRFSMIRGKMVSSKHRCRECQSREDRGTADQKG